MKKSNVHRPPGAAFVMTLAASAATLLPLAASASTPNVLFDLRVRTTGAKEATVSSFGEQVLIDLYAVISGNDADPANDRISLNSGAFLTSANGLFGEMLPSNVSPFNVIGSSPGMQLDADGDGDLDVSGTGDYSDGFFAFRVSPAPATQPPGGFLVGRLRYTARSVTDAVTEITYAARTGASSYLLAYFDGSSSPATAFTYTVSASPLLIRGAPVTPPQYLPGSVDDHLTASGTMLPAPGSDVLLARGVDVPAGMVVDLRASGGVLSGPSEARINDATSGNAGGTLIAPAFAIGTTDPGRYSQTAGTTSSKTATIGAGAAGALTLSGGSLVANTLIVGGASVGQFTQTGGISNSAKLDIAASAAASGSLYEFSAGSLTVPSGVRVGVAGQGTLRQDGGTATFNSATRVGAGGHGILEINGGTINQRSSLDVGFAGTGEVIQTGGSIFIYGPSGSAALNITPKTPQAGPTPTGTYTFRNGTLSTSSINVGLGGNGTFVQESGLVDFSGTATFSNTIFGTARLELRGGTFSPNGLQLGKAGTPASRGEVVQTGGTLDVSRLYIDGNSSYRMTGGSLLAGRVDQSGGVAEFSSLPLTSGKVYRMTGGTLGLLGDAAFTSGLIDLAHSASTLRTDGWTTFGSGVLSNTGQATLIIGPDSFVELPGDMFSMFASVQAEGLAHVAGQPMSIPSGRTLSGSGTFRGTLTNFGEVSPGNSPGAITVVGNYVQSALATLLIELAGPGGGEFDTLTVTGSASLDGILDVVLLDGVAPQPTDSFPILSAATLTGTFDNVIDGEITVPGGTFDVLYSSTGVTLTNFQAIPEPAASLGLALAGATFGLGHRRRS